jgi:hypothetical protein
MAEKFIVEEENFQDKEKFAVIASQVKMDKFTKPDYCNDQFDCRFICNEYITQNGLDYNIILNPTSTYTDNFRRVLEILEEMKVERRR